jgi:hypothetical protein
MNNAHPRAYIENAGTKANGSIISGVRYNPNRIKESGERRTTTMKGFRSGNERPSNYRWVQDCRGCDFGAIDVIPNDLRHNACVL